MDILVAVSFSRPGRKLVDVTCAFYNKSIFLSTLRKKSVNCLYSALACDSVHCVSYMQFALILYTFESYPLLLRRTLLCS